MRNNISDYGNLEKYIDPKIKGPYLEKLNQAVDWIYGDGQSAAEDIYIQKLKEFKDVGVPIKKRALFYQDFPIFNQQFKQFTQEVNDKFSTVTNLTDQTRADIINKLTEGQQYFSQVEQTVASKQTYEEPGFNIDDVHAKLESIK